ncbi:MAG: hypothetical protein WKF59_03385 [Chitinophagaceae bacterium]
MKKIFFFTNLISVLMLTLNTNLKAQNDSTNMLILNPYKFRTYDGKSYESDMGKLWVKENRNTNSKRLIQLSFVRLKSTSPSPAAPIIFLAGGFRCTRHRHGKGSGLFFFIQ